MTESVDDVQPAGQDDYGPCVYCGGGPNPEFVPNPIGGGQVRVCELCRPAEKAEEEHYA